MDKASATVARIFTAVAIAALILTSPAVAQMYRWVDEGGGVHYTQGLDSIPERHRKNAVRLDYPAPAPAPSSPSPGVLAPPGGVVVKPADSDTVIEFTPGKPIYVVARLNNAENTRLILDTGADRTVIAPRALQAAGVGSRAAAASGRIQGATGTAEVQAFHIDSIQVGSARVDRLLVLSHDINLPEGDGLLGRDFLEHFKVTIDNRAGTVTLAPK